MPSRQEPRSQANSQFQTTRHRVAPARTRKARALRRRATVPERILWQLLRQPPLCDFHFRRQHPLGRYVVDFFCARARLVIEVDGMSHLGRQEQDARREQWLTSQGYRVLHVLNDDVLRDSVAVAEYILQIVQQRI
ncbi:MAG: endonuclease domain-containing protein [Phycisphaeraceae bacterium]|nr:endonuclease domain-containing protein [Phycisphaeraceae bacterium]